ncbi:ATP-binding protein [Micromonospora sp. RP3T]|uniref:caspase, EACC1-associated type n=1 Tax=Micromonospora sp. RP3T TaxID=2135446 RepID=UPI000D166DF3|nr:ATP-binding protein [Micromonospora sp. RP3T]PTA42834.1 hypothetical protein C8054_28610 [Micromonospora sp. RP3T]
MHSWEAFGVYRALLICNSLYDSGASLSNLRGPRADGLELRDALLHAETGVFGHVELLAEHRFGEMAVAVNRFFAEAREDDILFLYFSGHGLSRSRQFYICARDTDINLLPATALSGYQLNTCIDESLARCKVLIFDCCHSGAFKGTPGAEEMAEQLAGEGRFVLTATAPTGLAKDSETAGRPSPFTRALVDGLRGSAGDADGDGYIDLDDLYAFLLSALPEEAEPQRRWEGSGRVRLARRLDRSATMPEPDDAVTPEPAGYGAAPGLSFLELPTDVTSFSSRLIADFRANLRADIARSMPSQLTDIEFLQRAHLLAAGRLTLTGALLFGESPAAALPTAIVQCARIHGVTKGVPMDKHDLKGSVTEQILGAVEFVAGLSRRGEAPTDDSPIARPSHRYPMVAVREVIANALVHRDYEHRSACVHVRVFDDRVEVVSPGTWAGRDLPPGTTTPLEALISESHRRNFRLASTLTWMRLVEGEGSGISRAINECRDHGAPAPTVCQNDGLVTVTIYPRREFLDGPTLALMSVEEAAAELERMGANLAFARLMVMPTGAATESLSRLDAAYAAELLSRMTPAHAARLVGAMRSEAAAGMLRRLEASVRRAIDSELAPVMGYVMIQVEANAVDQNQLIVSSWRQSRPGDAPVRGEDRITSRDGLERTTSQIVLDAEAALADHLGPVTIEFILPHYLLNEPIDEWLIGDESSMGSPRPFTMDYGVVVRSLERMRSPHLHRNWRKRWKMLSERPEQARAYVVPPGTTPDPTYLEAALQADEHVVAVVLSDAPSQSGAGSREVAAALRVGVPILLWHRDDCTAPEFRSALDLLLNGVEGLTRLPDRLRELRLKALMYPDEPSCRNLVLLWDDPQRLTVDLPFPG